MQRERSRLGTHNWQRGGPSRDQEVLHYQWFADMGNLDAQRQLARMFASGEEADLQRSLHYYRHAQGRDNPRTIGSLHLRRTARLQLW